MLCEKCKKNNASFFFEENINGKKRSLALCSECAEEMKKNGELNVGEMAIHSNILAWKIPWTEEPCRLQSLGS